MHEYRHHYKTQHHFLAWLVTLISALFFFYEFIQLNVFNSIDTDLMQDFNLTAPKLGQLAAMYFYANTLFLLPAGNLLDRFSTKRLLLITIALGTVGTFIFALAQTYFIAAFGRFLVGIAAAFCFLGSVRIATRWFAPAKMATVTGLIVMMGMLGGLVAQTPFALLTMYLGSWRHALVLDGFLGLVIFTIVLFIVQDRPPDSHVEASSDHAHLKNLGLWQCIKLATLNPQNWLGGIYTSLLNLPIFLLGALWGIHYLVEVRHLSVVQASYATTMLFVGVIFGSPIYGLFSDKIGRRVLPMVIGAILSLIVILALMYAPHLTLMQIMVLFFLIGFVTSSQVLTYPTIAELNPIYLTSTALSIDSMCIMIGGFVFQPFFGWIMEHSGPHTVVNGVVVYSKENFTNAMWIMPIAFIIGLIITFFIRETFCKSRA